MAGPSVTRPRDGLSPAMPHAPAAHFDVAFGAAQALAQAADEQVDGAVEGLGVAALGEVEQLISVQHALGVVEQHAQQTELAAGEGHQCALRVQQVARGGVQRPVAKTQGAGLVHRLQVGRQHAGAA